MASSLTVDLVRLSTPASEEQPAGPELRSALRKDDRALYYAVRDARKKAADSERRLRAFALLTEEERTREPGAPESADWETVCRLSCEALTTSKDLWITAWLIEALTRLHGFAGLRDGFRLAHELCERFWQDAHPQSREEADLATRFAQLAGLNGVDSEGTLIPAIMNVPMTCSTAIRALSFTDYQDALELERKDPKIQKRRVEQGAVTVDLFQRAISETAVEFLQNLLDDLQQANEAVDSFYSLVRGKVSDSAFVPPSSRIREALEECVRLCKALTKDVLHRPEKLGAGDAVMRVTSVSQSSSLVGAEVDTRQEVLRTLLQVSDYFRRAEPHSPVSYALEQAVRWARMSLPELLAELVTDKSAREEIFKRAGITL
jgi:type VI secretion system protein ImpA